MKPTTSLLPKKHLTMSESPLGIASLVSTLVTSRPSTLDKLWARFRKMEEVSSRCNGAIGLSDFVISIDLLYLMGVVTLDDSGRLVRADS